MKIGQRDVWIGVGKGKQTPKRVWVVFTPLGREWISAGCAGRSEGFWLRDVPRRLEIHCPPWSFQLALTPGSRFDGPRWMSFEKHRSAYDWIDDPNLGHEETMRRISALKLKPTTGPREA